MAIFRASSTEGPGYFATYLERRSIDWRLVQLDSGDAVPRDARKFAGLVFMGGPMSVNDELRWIIPALELVRDAVRKDVPVLGHCLGGQLMAKALGGAVRVNRVKEIGWGEVRVADIMQRDPVTATPEMDVNDLRRTMLESGARYLPVMQDGKLIGVISFRDVAKAVLEEQDFENKMLKGYIKNWPA